MSDTSHTRSLGEEVAGAQQPATSSGSREPASRRAFLATATRATAAASVAAVLGGAATRAFADPQGPIPAGDIAILRFLAAAELVEDDLWQQYAELAANNPQFRAALQNIDPALPRYIRDDRDDERSHAMLINGYLASIGEQPVNLDGFRRLPSVRAQGAMKVGRLTNLTRLNVDTSWYNRYRGIENPDLGGAFGQVVDIAGRSTIPTRDGLSDQQAQTIAHAAAFHFCAIEQGGSSLYAHLVTRVQSQDARIILASIGPTEVYHFAGFHKSLEGLFGFDSGDGLVFPDLKGNPAISQAIFPEPCRFLNDRLPLCSVIRPTSKPNAGALAAATGLVNSGLFAGQSNQFFNAVVALAQAADAV
jgi:hypothetical protein